MSGNPWDRHPARQAAQARQIFFQKSLPRSSAHDSPIIPDSFCKRAHSTRNQSLGKRSRIPPCAGIIGDSQNRHTIAHKRRNNPSLPDIAIDAGTISYPRRNQLPSTNNLQCRLHTLPREHYTTADRQCRLGRCIRPGIKRNTP